jgi:hypothetical protein
MQCTALSVSLPLVCSSYGTSNTDFTPCISVLALSDCSLLLEHLVSCGYSQAASVFGPEAGIGRDVLSEGDILELLNCGDGQPLCKHVMVSRVPTCSVDAVSRV